jgi:hypothetical protein
VSVIAATLAISGAGAAIASGGASGGLAHVRQATRQYRDVTAAERAQYERFVDVDGIACIDMPGMGAMGIHYVNQGLVGDATVDPLAPEAMVYEPEADGGLRLVAVEYVVVKAAWDATHSEPPALFGTTFDFTPSPNRFGLPEFYSLHAWVWKHNTAGTLSMWNPDVSCTAPAAHHG